MSEPLPIPSPMAHSIPTLDRDEREYPSRDGRPLGETDLHRDEIVFVIEALKARYADRDDVYVTGDLLIYYEEGNAKARFAPDVAVFFGVPKHRRRVYKLWLERLAPAFVLEVSSKGTWLEDMGQKRALCARLGVQEYFLFDPEGEWLKPPFQAFFHDGTDLRRVESDAPSREQFTSRALGLTLQREGQHLVLTDEKTGERLLRPEELARAREAAEHARNDAQARVRELEAELAALKGAREPRR